MNPKPPPPTSLLLRGQQWVVVPAIYWQVSGNTCYFVNGEGRHQRCGAPAVVMSKDHGSFSREGLCEEHMGSHLWIGDDGVLYQWRADPPYMNKELKLYERYRNRRST